MHLFHHHIHLHTPHALDYFKKDTHAIYLIHAMRGFVFSLLGFLIPVYLLTLGFSIQAVLIFYLFRSIGNALFAHFSGVVASRFGLKHTMMFSFPVALCYLASFALLKEGASGWFLFPIAILGSLQATFYWIPTHSLFAQGTVQKKKGSQVGKLLSFQHLASMIAPFLGGVISVAWGFHSLFVIAIFFLFIPIGILLYTKERKPHMNFDFRKGWKIIMAHPRHFWRTAVEQIGSGAEGVVWPIFIYLALADPLSVGAAGSFVGLGSIIFSFLVGKASDKYKPAVILKSGALILTALWLGRTFVGDHKIFIYILSTLAGFFMIMYAVPLTSRNYELAKKSKMVDEFVIFHELPVTIGKVFLLLIALIFVSKIELSFLAASLGYLVAFFL